jgi:restriction system protein
MAEKTVWGIHAGPEGEGDSLFINNKVVAIRWHDIGDLSKYKDRDEFKRQLEHTHTDMSLGAIRNAAGILYRFVYEMKIGDLIIYPSQRSKRIYIGEIKSEYKYQPDAPSNFVNQRNVDWKGNYPRTIFAQSALYEIGSALTLFQVKNYPDEFIAALDRKPEEGGVAAIHEETEEVAAMTENVESQTKDFVLKQIQRNYKGDALEDFIVDLLETVGYHARKTSTNTPSVDIIAHKDQFGFEAPLIKCQVKSADETIKLEPVEKLYSRLNQGEYGLFIALSDYNDKVVRFAEAKHNLRLIDGYELVDIVLEHYDKLDIKHKNTIPLDKVFLPSVTK